MRGLRKQDATRMKNAAKKVTEKYRKRRQKLLAQKKDKVDRQSYQPGGFGQFKASQREREKKEKGLRKVLKNQL